MRISDWSSDVCSSDLYGARAGMKPILVQGIQPGGQLMTTTDVENYPGFADVIQGPWLMEQMQKQAEHVGTSLVWDTVVAVDLSRRPFRLTGDSGDRAEERREGQEWVSRCGSRCARVHEKK